MRKHPITISMILSSISLLATTWINIQIAKKYIRSSGKTRALFSLTEMLQFGYQYYIALLGFFAMMIALFSKHKQKNRIIAIVFSVFAIAVVFFRIWRIFIT